MFCSPFRIFGDEGLKLEGEWNKQCGKSLPSYKTPVAIAETDRIQGQHRAHMAILGLCLALKPSAGDISQSRSAATC